MSERHDGYVTGPIHMVRTEHSKEPWREGKNYGAIVSDEGAYDSWGRNDDDVAAYGGHLVCESVGAKDKRRIIACVNVLEGWSTEDLEEILARGSRIRKVAP